jgi:hypothetical protein
VHMNFSDEWTAINASAKYTVREKKIIHDALHEVSCSSL